MIDMKVEETFIRFSGYRTNCFLGMKEVIFLTQSKKLKFKDLELLLILFRYLF
jgi:hypothetical protein